VLHRFPEKKGQKTTPRPRSRALNVGAYGNAVEHASPATPGGRARSVAGGTPTFCTVLEQLRIDLVENLGSAFLGLGARQQVVVKCFW